MDNLVIRILLPVCALLGTGRECLASSPAERALEHSLPYNYAAGGMFANPALKPYQYADALCRVEGGWDGSADGCRGVFDASAYMPLESSRHDATVWGDASYHNGWQMPDGMIESADYDIVRPYALADTVGGRQDAERYAFGGGYATRGRLGWGVSGSYVASLSYRDRDPRPRNVCGTLDVAAGMSLRIGARYVVAAGAGLWRYKQTSSIMFMSELGEPVVYHLTGLGMSYARFNSLGKSTHYSALGGTGWLSLLPVGGAGFFADAEAGGFKMDYILKDLNNLPMARLKTRTLSGRAGWRMAAGRRFVSASAFVEHHRRRGTENIFGEASTGIYPQIASLALYESDMTRYGIDLSGVAYLGARHLVSLTASCSRLNSADVYVSPARRMAYDAWQMSVCPAYSFHTDKWLVQASVGYGLFAASNRECTGLAGIDSPTVRDAVARFGRETRNLNTVTASATAVRAINAKVALTLGVSGMNNAAGSALSVRAGVVF